ncbi:Carotenoid oxygenase [Cynara cardunculus var. scolymus]|uniref:Carotenoid oxygenase n=1 Tax=Cynara cardunculus var. scolymus TaxID=59895 RepID=A0A103SST8_CYNCS|nr:Carotenoid oxygenase [Cynara cardunculus var. scolymus]
MDPLSLSFRSTVSTRPPPPLSLSTPPSQFRILSVRNGEKPQTVTSTTKRSSQDRSKWPTITSNDKKRVTKSAKIDWLLLSMIFNAFDDIINKFIDPPTRDSVNPWHVLLDNFYPVDELPPTDCEVSEGMLLSCLDGVYFRNGPNPQFLPRGPYHLFDGDGKFHAIRISKGKAMLCSRYVKTNKYNIEKDAGFPMIPNVLSGFNGLTASVASQHSKTELFLSSHIGYITWLFLVCLHGGDGGD